MAMVSRMSLQFLQMAVLARLLLPTDFGLMALVAAVLAILQGFSDMGISDAIIHHQEISQNELSSLYWLNVAAAVGLALALILLSPLIASFYNEPSLTPTLMVVSSYFVVVAIGQQLRVLAEKSLRFADLARIELFATMVGFIVAVTWACIAPSVSALIAGLLSSALAQTTLFWVFLANGWKPLLRLRPQEIKRFICFGGYMLASNLVNTFNSQADILIGGQLLPSVELGRYSLPRRLCWSLAAAINPVVTRVGLPVMAKFQNERALLKYVYLKTLRTTASINIPLYSAVIIFAPEIIYLLFGAAWLESIPLLRVLALWGMLRSIGNPVGSLILAVGRADLALKWNIALSLFIFPALWFGAQFGGIGLATTQVMLLIFLLLPGWYFLIYPLTGICLKEYFTSFGVPMLVTVIATVLAYVSVISVAGATIRLMLGLSVGGATYVIVSMRLNRQWIDVIIELFKRP